MSHFEPTHALRANGSPNDGEPLLYGRLVQTRGLTSSPGNGVPLPKGRV